MRERFKEWSPAPGLVVFAWLLTLAAAAWFVALTISGSDPAGRLLAGVAAIGAAIAAFFGTRARPRLPPHHRRTGGRPGLGAGRYPRLVVA